MANISILHEQILYYTEVTPSTRQAQYSMIITGGSCVDISPYIVLQVTQTHVPVQFRI